MPGIICRPQQNAIESIEVKNFNGVYYRKKGRQVFSIKIESVNYRVFDVIFLNF